MAMATVPSGSRAPAPPADTSGQRVVYDTVAKTWRIEQPADGTVQLRKNMLSGHILYMMGDVDGNRNDFCSGRYNRRDELIGGAPSYIHNKCSDLLIWYVPQHKNWNIGPRRGVIDGKCWMWSSNDPTAQHVTKVDWYRAADRKKIGLRLYSDPTDTQVARSAMDRKSRGELKPDTRDGNPGKRVQCQKKGCGKIFESRNKLFLHIRAEHESWPPLPPPPSKIADPAYYTHSDPQLNALLPNGLFGAPPTRPPVLQPPPPLPPPPPPPPPPQQHPPPPAPRPAEPCGLSAWTWERHGYKRPRLDRDSHPVRLQMELDQLRDREKRLQQIAAESTTLARRAIDAAQTTIGKRPAAGA